MTAAARLRPDDEAPLPTSIKLGMGLSEMLALGFCHRRRVLVALLSPLLVAVVLVLVLPPKYRAASSIMVKTGREYVAQDAEGSLTGPTSTKQEGINSEIELLTSRPVIKAVIKAVGLAELYPGLLESPPWFETTLDAAVDKFNKDLTVEPVKLSNVIDVKYDATSPEKAQRVLDKLIAIYINKHTQVFAGSHSDSYADAITRSVDEIHRLEAERTRLKLESGIYDIAAQRGALIAQRVAAESHLLAVMDTAEQMRARLATFGEGRVAVPRTARSSSTVPSDELVRLQQALVDLRATEAKMATHFAGNYPDLQSVRDQIASLERRGAGLRDRVNTTTAPSAVGQQIDTEMVMDRAQLAPLPAEQGRYEALVTSLNAELRRLEQADLQLRTLGIRIDAMNDTLRQTQARYGTARTQEDMDSARQVSVVQIAPAESPDAPVKPRGLLLITGGILLGLLAGGGVLVLAIVTSNTVLTEDGAERLIGLPVLVALPMAARRSPVVTLAVE